MPSGYGLDLAGGHVDVFKFEQLAGEAARRRRAGDLGGASRLATHAMTLVRGAVSADMPDVPFVRAARASLERAVLETEVLRLAAGNDLGLSADVLPAAEALASRQSGRDRRNAADASARWGRQAVRCSRRVCADAYASDRRARPRAWRAASDSSDCHTEGRLLERGGRSRSRPAWPPAASTDTIAWPGPRGRRTRGSASRPARADHHDDRSGWRREDASRPGAGVARHRLTRGGMGSVGTASRLPSWCSQHSQRHSASMPPARVTWCRASHGWSEGGISC